MIRGHVPIRTCAGCRRPGPKPTLTRFTLVRERLEVDPAGKLGGRGAYLHSGGGCAEAFLTRKPFLRSLRASVDSRERARFVAEIRSAKAQGSARRLGS